MQLCYFTISGIATRRKATMSSTELVPVSSAEQDSSIGAHVTDFTLFLKNCMIKG